MLWLLATLLSPPAWPQRPDPPPAVSVAPPTKIEQTAQGQRPPATLAVSFDGLGNGFTGPQGTMTARNPSDNSLAVGPGHIAELASGRMAVFDRKGTVAPDRFYRWMGSVASTTPDRASYRGRTRTSAPRRRPPRC